jgi:hypothetical protein
MEPKARAPTFRPTRPAGKVLAVSAVHYKAYVIEPFETEPGRYRALVRRIDGQKIKTFPDRQEHDSITTGGMESFSADDAVHVAKKMIDGGGMS